MIKNRKEVTLSEIMDFKNGLNFTKSDNGEKIKIVGVSDFKDLTELNSTDNLDVVSISSKIKNDELLKDGDLLFVRSNGNKELIGRCLYFPTVTERLSFSGFTIRGRVKDKNVLPAYVAQLSRTSLIKKEINKNGGGTNISNLSQQILNAIVIKLPEYVEQIKIVEILSTWDNAIQTTEKLLENSRRQKKALMQKLLGKGEQIFRLEDLGSTFTGLSGKSKVDFGKGKPYIPYMNIFINSHIDIQHLELVEIGKDETQNKVRYGDIFFTTSSETPDEVGMSSVLLNEVDELYLNSFCFGFRLNNFENLLPEYAQYLFRCDEIRKAISLLGQGATRYNLSKTQLMKLTIKLPSLEEQREIAEILSTAEQEIETLQRKLECLKLEKGALMQRLLG